MICWVIFFFFSVFPAQPEESGQDHHWEDDILLQQLCLSSQGQSDFFSGKVLALKIENFLYTNYLFFQRNKYFILNLYLIKMTLLYSNTFSGAFDY